MHQRKAQLVALQAQLKYAQVHLEFTAVRSTIDGVISRVNITKGNNVQTDQSVLTSIVSNKAMYTYFDIGERTWNRSFEAGCRALRAQNQQAAAGRLGAQPVSQFSNA